VISRESIQALLSPIVVFPNIYRSNFDTDCSSIFQTSSCPVCRYQLPTDDEEFEEMLKYKKREKQRKEDLENLHDSMFG